ncbi:MAG TPA: CRTAC1 family protein [Candidatus Sabulitectum sp.]|nr:CRTAC1 family protein [Candidatus Sabulitectum sp.]HPR21347.1 CRTAC1 family protein [Candidatus Sabulitectum sp.]
MRGILPLLAACGAALSQQVFTEVSGEMGISGQTGLGHAAAWCDTDNDGDLDLSFSNQDGSGFWLYRNDGSGFTNVTAAAGLSGQGAGRIIWGEFTGDQHSDLVLSRSSSTRFFVNDGDGTFTDMTQGSGITGSPSLAADMDLDGELDLLTMTSSGCAVLLNSGNGVFSPGPGAQGDWWCAACLDYDLDMDPDIYLGTYGSAANTLLRNDVSVLTDVTVQAGVEYGGSTTGITAGDWNNDGLPDLYLANYSAPGCILFENNGDGTFSDVTSSAGVTGHTDTRTAAFTDYNNDGWADIFVSHHDFYYYSNIMWRNNGDGTFSDVGSELGLSGEFMGDYFGTAWGDFDDDGDQDLFAAGHIDKYVLFRNDRSETIPGNYLTVTLRGTDSNRDAVGAMATVTHGSGSVTRWVSGGEGYHDLHSFPLEFGLYDRENVELLEIRWPSGLVETCSGIPANQHIVVVEGEGMSGSGGSHEETGTVSLTLDSNPCMGPVSGILFPGEGLVSVYDCSGRIVQRIQVDTGILQWDPGDRSGLFILRYESSSGTAVSRAVILP